MILGLVAALGLFVGEASADGSVIVELSGDSPALASMLETGGYPVVFKVEAPGCSPAYFYWVRLSDTRHPAFVAEANKAGGNVVFNNGVAKTLVMLLPGGHPTFKLNPDTNFADLKAICAKHAKTPVRLVADYQKPQPPPTPPPAIQPPAVTPPAAQPPVAQQPTPEPQKPNCNVPYYACPEGCYRGPSACVGEICTADIVCRPLEGALDQLPPARQTLRPMDDDTGIKTKRYTFLEPPKSPPPQPLVPDWAFVAVFILCLALAAAAKTPQTRYAALGTALLLIGSYSYMAKKESAQQETPTPTPFKTGPPHKLLGPAPGHFGAPPKERGTLTYCAGDRSDEELKQFTENLGGRFVGRMGMADWVFIVEPIGSAEEFDARILKIPGMQRAWNDPRRSVMKMVGSQWVCANENPLLKPWP